MTHRPVIWVTRAAPACEATAHRLSKLGFDAIAAPVIALEATGRPMPEGAQAAEAVVLTSRNAVQFALEAGLKTDLPAWCVGSATAEAADAAGFSIAHVGSGGAQELSRDMTSQAQRAMNALHPVNEAGEVFPALAGVRVVRWEVYRPVAVSTLDGRIMEHLEHGTLDALVIHSAKGAYFTWQLFEPKSPGALVVFAISKQAAAPLAELRNARTVVAENPSEASLLKAIENEFN